MLSEQHHATVGLSAPGGLGAEALGGAAKSVLPPLPNADQINQEAVDKLVAMGFSEAQAKSIIANAKKTPAEVAAEAQQAAKGYVESIASRAAVDKLMAAGFTEEEAKRIVASGRNVDALVANLKQIALRKIDDLFVQKILNEYGKLGITPIEAQALTLAVSDPAKLIELLKNPKKRVELLKAINARFKEAGIDLEERVSKGLDLTDKDKKTLGAAVKAAQGAYEIYAGISSAIDAYAQRNYFAGRWSEESMSDNSLSALATTLQDLADQTEQDRALRQKRMVDGIRRSMQGAATVAAAFGPYGLAVGAVITAASFLIDIVTKFEPEKDDNGPEHKELAKTAPNALWTRWFLVPPTFDTRYYTLRSYGETVQQQVQWLEESDAEIVALEGTSWREDFFDTIYNSVHRPLSGGDDIALPVFDLAALGWFPFTFSDWAGGANYPKGNHFKGIPGFGDLTSMMDVDIMPTSGEDIDDDLLVGNPGIYVGPGRDATFRAFVFRNKESTYEARNQNTVDPKTGWLGSMDADNNVVDLGIVTPEQDNAFFLLPRNAPIQRLICDRIAAALGTMVAVTRGKPAEPIVEAAVKASRQAIQTYGWQPRYAAKRLRDTFRTAVAIADRLDELVDAPKYAKIASVSIVDRVSPELTNLRTVRGL